MTNKDVEDLAGKMVYMEPTLPKDKDYWELFAHRIVDYMEHEKWIISRKQ